jgi:hypothetical protein
MLEATRPMRGGTIFRFCLSSPVRLTSLFEYPDFLGDAEVTARGIVGDRPVSAASARMPGPSPAAGGSGRRVETFRGMTFRRP